MVEKAMKTSPTHSFSKAFSQKTEFVTTNRAVEVQTELPTL